MPLVHGFSNGFFLDNPIKEGCSRPGNYNDVPRALSVDAAANVYVTGYSFNLNRPPMVDKSFTTIKYDAIGNELWAAISYFNFINDPSALAIDGAGNVYVTGESTGSGTFTDYATIKYDASGNELCVARYNRPDIAQDHTRRTLAVDAAGNVYATGSITGLDASIDYITIKLSANCDASDGDGSDGGNNSGGGGNRTGGGSNSGGGGGGTCFIKSITTDIFH